MYELEGVKKIKRGCSDFYDAKFVDWYEDRIIHGYGETEDEAIADAKAKIEGKKKFRSSKVQSKMISKRRSKVF